MGINFFSISVYVPLKMWYYGIVVKIGLIFMHKGNSLVFFRVKNMKGEWNEKRKNCCWFISSCAVVIHRQTHYPLFLLVPV